jgi:membrane protein
MPHRDDHPDAPEPLTAPRRVAGMLSYVGGFLRRLAQRFLGDRCLERAAALSFTSILSLVPVAAISLAFLSVLPQSEQIRAGVEEMLADYLLPHASGAAIDTFRDLVGRARNLTGISFIGLAVTALMLLATVNTAFDAIWRVTRPRPLMIRLLAYWAILSVGPLLIGGALSLSGALLTAGARYGGAAFTRPMGWLTPYVPFLLEVLAFTLLYYVAPNRRVSWQHALAGGIVAALMFEGAKYGMALYIVLYPTYDRIYGALAAIPVALVWIYLCWVATLLGAEVAATLLERREQREAE